MTLSAADERELAVLEAYFENANTSGIERYSPHTPHPAQQRFLDVDCLEALYGGAAGGGKSDALLMAALQYVHVDGYAALILRRTFQQLKLPGALMDRAHEWWDDTTARWSADTKTWHFPGGGSITFGFLETDGDIYRYQGPEFQSIAFDELTQFTERQYTYLISRLRRTKGRDLESVPLRIRGASNPGGVGHRWVVERFGLRKDGTQEPEHRRPFIPAKLDDNPSVDAESYLVGLRELDDTTRDQLERGLWVADGKGRIYPFDADAHGEAELLTPRQVIERDQGGVRFDIENRWEGNITIDLGASESEPTTSFTVTLWHPHVTSTWIALSYKLAGLDVTAIAEEAKRLKRECRLSRVVVDHGALGIGYMREFRARHGLACYEAQKRDKLGFRKLMRGAIQRGHIRVVVAQCEDLVKEWDDLIWDDRGLDAARGLADHCSDGALYGWRDSRSFRAESPAERPAPGSPEADDVEAKRIEAQERQRHKRGQGRADWESW